MTPTNFQGEPGTASPVVVRPAGTTRGPGSAGSPQLPASEVRVAHDRSTPPAEHEAARRLSVLVELLSRVQTAESTAQACVVLADELQRYLECRQVAVGLRRRDSTWCEVKAISQVRSFHSGSAEVRRLQGALQEAIARDQVSLWPPEDENSRFGLLALEQYATRAGLPAVLASPLRDEAGVVRGAWLIAGAADNVCGAHTRGLLAAAAAPVASALQLLRRAEPGWLGALIRGATELIRGRRAVAILVAVLVMAAALFIPVPFRIRCDCQLEPVTRRFVAAPFDGQLQETHVRPGDLVTEGQLLARMDGREIRWELAGVQAELYRATKELAGQVASHQAGEAELTRHEVERLRFREQLLQSRDQNLELRSPVDGVVVSGDLQDAEGIPLKVGEVLFEVAPLDELDVELAIGEDDLPSIHRGLPVRVTFDAFPWHSYQSTIERIHPRAEIRDDRNVFVAQVRLPNPQRALHPGMRGHARVLAGQAPLGWILLRRPLAALLDWLGW